MRKFLLLACAIAACAAPGPDVGQSEQAAANNGSWRMPSRNIYYTIAGGLPANDVRSWIATFFPGGPLTFIEGTAPSGKGQINFINDPDYATKPTGLTHSTGTTSTIHVGPPVSEGTIHHEMGHAVGLMHEHERPDRCDAVVINCACTDEGCIAGSAKTSCEPNGAPADVGDWQINDQAVIFSDYDVDSVMQYSSYNDGGTDSCRSIKTVSGGTIDGSTNLSKRDKNAIWAMYFPSLGDDEPDDRLGMATASGDFDDDGYTDVAVGAPGENGRGEVFVYKGSWLGLIPWKVLTEEDFGLSLGATQHDAFGTTLAAGNLDSDSGPAELFVGAPGRTKGGKAGAGAVFMYKGNTVGGPIPAPYGELSAGFTYQTEEAGAMFGQSIAVMGKRIDGKYLAIGAPLASMNGVRSGKVTILKWSNVSFVSYEILNGDGNWPAAPADGNMFGWSLAAGDFDGDGITDLAVGSPESIRVPNTGGAVYFFRDNWMGGLSPDQKLRPAETQASDHFGFAIAAGNIDGKYGGELVVGAPVRANSAGKIYVLTDDPATSAINMSRTSAFTLQTLTAGDLFGSAIDVGDLDGDGKADIVTGAPGWSNGQGKIQILHGEANVPPDRAQAFTTSYASQLGSAVAIGQFDSSGDKDIAIGAPYNSGRLVDYTTVMGIPSYRVYHEASSGLW